MTRLPVVDEGTEPAFADGDDGDPALDTRVGPAPARVLCQTERGSCAACCGVFNFRDRGAAAQHRRLAARTIAVRRAWPDPSALALARDERLSAEAPERLFAGIRTCPFAGYVDAMDDDDALAALDPEEASRLRVGCLLHPSRHPTGDDLRDLSVHSREVCAGHFCAPHDWLRPAEAALAATVVGSAYGRVVTDAGLVKSLARRIDDACGGRVPAERYETAGPALQAGLAQLWRTILDWPFRDPDPHRFGPFYATGEEATERQAPSVAVIAPLSDVDRRLLDALGSRIEDPATLDEALALLGTRIAAVAKAVEDEARPTR